jgi:hypothetical protein
VAVRELLKPGCEGLHVVHADRREIPILPEELASSLQASLKFADVRGRNAPRLLLQDEMAAGVLLKLGGLLNAQKELVATSLLKLLDSVANECLRDERVAGGSLLARWHERFAFASECPKVAPVAVASLVDSGSLPRHGSHPWKGKKTG